jgi:hypothetical protein
LYLAGFNETQRNKDVFLFEKEPLQNKVVYFVIALFFLLFFSILLKSLPTAGQLCYNEMDYAICVAV